LVGGFVGISNDTVSLINCKSILAGQINVTQVYSISGKSN